MECANSRRIDSRRVAETLLAQRLRNSMKSTTFESGAEQVSIESICVGDFVFTHHPAPGVGARCVLAKHAKTNERTERIVGWLVELNGGSLAWWPHGATVWRRR